MDQNSDTWGNKEADQAPACPECGTALRTGGPGRRPHFCSRACSAKAYRRRRAEKHQDAVADALVSTRVEIPASGEAGRQELLDLAAAVQRTAARYLESLEEATVGEGDDPQCVRALERLEASLGAASTRIVRKAHHLRYEMVVARRKAERATPDAPPQHLDTAPAESSRDEVRTAPATAPAAAPVLGAAVHPAAPLTRAAVPPAPRPHLGDAPVESTRDEVRSAPAVPEAAATPRGVVVPAPQHAAGAAVPAGPRAHLAGTLGESPRVGTRYAAADRQPSALAPGVVVPAPQHAAGDVPQDQLALAAERTSTSPLLRGLGAPSQTWSVQGGALIIEGWASGTVFAVRGADRSLAGWVEESADTGGWATFIDGRALVDSADGLPWLAQDERFAVTLLTTALRRRLA